MKGINPLRYYVNNIKKMIVFITIVSVAVFCIATIMTIISSIYTTCHSANVEAFNKVSVVQANQEELGSWAEENEDKYNFYDADITTTNISTVLGTTSSYIFAVDKLEEIFDDFDLQMSSGDMPTEGKKEIIINESIAKNKKVKVGDKIGDFKVIGIFTGTTQINLCYKKDIEELYGEQSGCTLVTPKSNETIEKVNESIKDLNDNIEIINVNSQQKDLDKEFETMNLIMKLIIFMVSISLSIAVSAFVYTSYSNRNEEFAIYYALGYGVNNIIRLIMEETVIISLLAYFIGNVIEIICMKIVEISIYKPLGQEIQLVSLTNILYTLAIPGLVILFSTIPVIYKLKKTDLLTLIERR